MAKVEPINIQIDPNYLREQVKTILDSELAEFADKLRFAANTLDPSWAQEHAKWTEEQIEIRVEKKLKEARDE